VGLLVTVGAGKSDPLGVKRVRGVGRGPRFLLPCCYCLVRLALGASPCIYFACVCAILFRSYIDYLVLLIQGAFDRF